MADRTVTIGGVWANGAPNLPGGGPPAEGVTYANSALDNTTITAGWPFASIVHSENFNEIMRRLTSLVSQMETYGVLPWCATTNYPAGALAMGSDGVAYQALSVNVNKNPIAFPSVWVRVKTDATPAGVVIYTAAATPPAGYLEANGAAVNRLTYADLFSAIGTLYGAGDGASTFNLPDLRGEFIRGWDNGKGTDSGRLFGTWQQDDFKSHNHTGPTFKNLLKDGYNGSVTGSDTTGSGPSGEAAVGTGDWGPMINAGGTETRPRNVALMPCIKF